MYKQITASSLEDLTNQINNETSYQLVGNVSWYLDLGRTIFYCILKSNG